MFFKIDLHSSTPVYRQLIEQVKLEYAAGRLRPGDRLPTIRDVAAELRINRNTVARVYSELEREGLLVSRSGQGCFISNAASGRLSEEATRADLTGLLDGFIAQARVHGLARDEVHKLITERLAVFYPPNEESKPSNPSE
ncbi:MAG: GntR family transcriptional regulator, partial [Candidatus Sumerlaeia bacterium]|nr:GntR family transcriptional regulator [Candidatus Sumerlaeia bacterium]